MALRTGTTPPNQPIPMRLAGTICDEDQARRFYGYLLTLGISSKVEPGDGGFAVWIREEEHLEQAVGELAEFNRQPDEPRYAKASEIARRIVRQEGAKDRKARKNYIELRQRWKTGVAGRQPVSSGLIAASIVVAICTQFGEQQGPVLGHLTIAQVAPAGLGQIRFAPGLSDVANGQVWRLVTPIFIHFGLWHIGFNSLAMLSLGRRVESQRGSWRMLLLVLAIAVPSNIAQYWATGHPLFGGLSGVLYGLFGYLWVKGRFEPASGMGVHPQEVVMIVIWTAVCYSGQIGPIGNTAHMVGMVTGIVIGLAPVVWRQIGR